MEWTQPTWSEYYCCFIVACASWPQFTQFNDSNRTPLKFAPIMSLWTRISRLWNPCHKVSSVFWEQSKTLSSTSILFLIMSLLGIGSQPIYFDLFSCSVFPWTTHIHIYVKNKDSTDSIYKSDICWLLKSSKVETALFWVDLEDSLDNQPSVMVWEIMMNTFALCSCTLISYNV